MKVLVGAKQKKFPTLLGQKPDEEESAW